MPVLLSEQDVRIVLPMPDLIEAMATALAKFSAHEATQPLRTVIEVGLQKAFVGVMPALIDDPAMLGTKVVSVFGSNSAVGLPTHLATIVLLDAMTGELLAIMDGRYITEARTAAVSAVSVKQLARDDAARLAIIGSGVQARSHLEAIASVRPLREIRVWSRSLENRTAFAREMRPRTTATMKVATSARDAVDGADLIVLATASREPVVCSRWIADGAHVCAVGACRPDQREMDSELVARGRVFVDSRTGALAEAGDIILAIKDGTIDEQHVAGELGEVVIGKIAGRTSPNDVTIFKSLGMAVEDVAAAHLAYVKAAERGLGRGFVL
jgi:ornithine cyclodeaminase/alanine dehydrogenase-like protein (mu-crystallin family)